MIRSKRSWSPSFLKSLLALTSKLSVLPANPLPWNSTAQVDITMSLLVWAISAFNLQSDEPFSQIMGTVDERCNLWGGSLSDK